MITLKARAEAIGRANRAMARLEGNPNTPRRTLGIGRDAINTVWNNAHSDTVTEALDLVETMAQQIGAAA